MTSKFSGNGGSSSAAKCKHYYRFEFLGNCGKGDLPSDFLFAEGGKLGGGRLMGKSATSPIRFLSFPNSCQ